MSKRNPFSTRARRDQMTKAERARLSRGLVTWLESLGATTRLDSLGRYDGHEVETSAGTLLVHYRGGDGFVHCRFADANLASVLYYGRALHPLDSRASGQLNPYSGKFNFYFGRTTGEAALDEVKRCLAWCLPA